MSLARSFLALLLVMVCSPALAQDKSEQLSFPQDYRGKAITVSGQLLLPPGADKVPALLIHHGSGGISAGTLSAPGGRSSWPLTVIALPR